MSPARNKLSVSSSAPTPSGPQSNEGYLKQLCEARATLAVESSRISIDIAKLSAQLVTTQSELTSALNLSKKLKQQCDSAKAAAAARAASEPPALNELKLKLARAKDALRSGDLDELKKDADLRESEKMEELENLQAQLNQALIMLENGKDEKSRLSQAKVELETRTAALKSDLKILLNQTVTKDPRLSQLLMIYRDSLKSREEMKTYLATCNAKVERRTKAEDLAISSLAKILDPGVAANSLATLMRN